MKKKVKTKAARWTAADEEVLINNVRENVTNLAKAFRQTSKELQRSTLACSAHWYANTSIKCKQEKWEGQIFYNAFIQEGFEDFRPISLKYHFSTEIAYLCKKCFKT